MRRTEPERIAVRRAIMFLCASFGTAALSFVAVMTTDRPRTVGPLGFVFAALLAVAGALSGARAAGRAFARRSFGGVMSGLGFLGANGLMALLGPVLTVAFRQPSYLDADPVPPLAGRVWSVQYSRHGGIAGLSVAVCCGVGLLGALLPGWRAGRREPYDLVRGEGV